MAIELLCELIAQNGRASAASYRQRAGYSALVRSGLLHEGGVVQSVACVDCDAPHDAEVVYHEHTYGYWCPDLGFVRLDGPMLAGVVPDLTTLVAKLAHAFECKRRKSTPVRGEMWRVGAIETPVGDVMIYLHPRLLSGHDVRDAEAALRSQVGSAFIIVLAAVGTIQVPGAKTVCLSEVVDLALDAGALVPIADLRAVVGATTKSQVGAPNMFGDRIAAIIASRARSGVALSGRNEEARAILDAFRSVHSGEQAPSLPTIKRYLSEARRGS